MMNTFNNTALITGASSGIGKELARIHAQKGGDLILVARREEKLNEIKTSLEKTFGVSVMIIPKDLTHENSAKEIYEEVTAAEIEVDILINNAGFGGLGKFHERNWETDLSMIQLNIIALAALTRFFLPDFVQRNRGKILQISSTASLLPGPMQAVYFATKAFVTSFSNAVAEELHDTQVTVTALLPGATQTEFGSTSGMDKTKMFASAASPEAVANDGYQGMLEGKLNVVTGLPTAQKLLMFAVPFLPKKFLLKQIRKMQEV